MSAETRSEPARLTAATVTPAALDGFEGSMPYAAHVAAPSVVHHAWSRSVAEPAAAASVSGTSASGREPSAAATAGMSPSDARRETELGERQVGRPREVDDVGEGEGLQRDELERVPARSGAQPPSTVKVGQEDLVELRLRRREPSRSMR